jgi:hypothetical protein
MPTLDDVFSEALKEAYASAPGEAIVLATLEIRHPAFVDDQGNPLSAVRIVADGQDLAAKIEAGAPADAGSSVLFRACPVEVVPPEHSTSALPEARVSIDNATAELMPNLKLAVQTSDPIQVSYREYLAHRAHLGPEFAMHGFTAKRAVADLMRVTATIGFFDLLNAAFPDRVYEPEDFRGLVSR